jgi:hypothetical protein
MVLGYNNEYQKEDAIKGEFASSDELRKKLNEEDQKARDLFNKLDHDSTHKHIAELDQLLNDLHSGRTKKLESLVEEIETGKKYANSEDIDAVNILCAALGIGTKITPEQAQMYRDRWVNKRNDESSQEQIGAMEMNVPYSTVKPLYTRSKVGVPGRSPTIDTWEKEFDSDEADSVISSCSIYTEMGKKMVTSAPSAVSTSFRGVPDSIIHPSASASQIGAITPRNKYDVLLNNQNMQPQQTMDRSISIVTGYKPNKEDLYESINMSFDGEVNGLCTIFHDPRLNFLHHLHMSLYNVTNNYNTYPPIDILKSLSEFYTKHRESRKTGKLSAQHEMFMKVMVHTFSSRRMSVRDNPYKLPIIEPGMKFNDRIIFLCFKSLHDEYQTRWVNSFKDTTMPPFAIQSRMSMGIIPGRRRAKSDK